MLFNSIQLVLMMGAPGGSAAGGGSNPTGMLVLFGGMFVVMYFFMIRPQQKKAKDQKTFQEAIDKGDKIVTLSGMHGKVVKVNDNTFELEIANSTVITIEKSVISLEVTQATYPKEKK